MSLNRSIANTAHAKTFPKADGVASIASRGATRRGEGGSAAGASTPPQKRKKGHGQFFRLARHELFLKQEWTLPFSTVSKKGKQRRQTEKIHVSKGEGAWREYP